MAKRITDSHELRILKKFEERVSDLNQDEATCTRFLIAREFQLDAAEAMLRKNIEWRKVEEINTVTKWNPLPKYLLEDLPFRIEGKSRSGGPVVWIPLGIWKARFWVEQGKKDEILRYVFYMLENVLHKIKDNGNRKAIVIFEMEELTYWKVSHMDTLRLLFNGFQTLEQNYPEILENILVINAPWAFTIGFNFVKPTLSKQTLNKVQIYGTDRSKWIHKLEEVIEEHSIPNYYLN